MYIIICMIEDPLSESNQQEDVSEAEMSTGSLNHIDKLSGDADDTQTRVRTVLASISNKQQLETLLNEFQYTADAVRMIRENLPTGEGRALVLDFAADILVDTWERDPSKAGAMATLLSQTWKDWQPDAMMTMVLVEMCDEAMRMNNTAMVAVVQPAAYVLGALGQHEFYGEWLRTTTMEERWRKADFDRNKIYYASPDGTPREHQLAAIERHLDDPNRTGLLLAAHDIGLLFQIGVEHIAEGLPNNDPEVQRANFLLARIVRILEEHQQDELVAYIRQYRTT